MSYVLTKYFHKYAIYVTLLKKVCLCQGECKTESYTESNQKTNNLEDVDPLLLNILCSIHYAYAILYVQLPFLSIQVTNKSQDITNHRPNASTLEEQIRIENKQIEVIM